MSDACIYLNYLQHFFIEYALTEEEEIKKGNKKDQDKKLSM